MEKMLREKLINGRFSNVPAFRSKMMSAIKSSSNQSTEMKFLQAMIDARILNFQLNAKLIGNPDIYFPLYKLAVFLDGCFWHGCSSCGHIPKTNTLYWQTKIGRNQQRDLEKRAILQDMGFTVVQFWEHEIKHNLPVCVKYLTDVIENNLYLICSYEDV